MQVPTYKNQTKLPKQTGASPLTVQASPAQYSQGSEAIYQATQKAVTAATAFAVQLQKTDRAAEEARQKGLMGDVLDVTLKSVMKREVGDWVDRTGKPYETYSDWYEDLSSGLKYKKQQAVANISDKIVRARVAADWDTAIAASLNQARAIFRPRWIDSKKALIKGDVLKTVQDIALMSANTPAERKAKEAAITNLHDKLDVHASHFVNLGDTFFLKTKKDLGNDIAERAIQPHIAAIRTSADAEAWKRRLTDPTYEGTWSNDIKRLSGDTVTKLLTRLERIDARLKNAEDNKAHREMVQHSTKKKIQGTDLFNKTSREIQIYRNLIAAGKEPDIDGVITDDAGNQYKMPAAVDIDMLITSDGYSMTGAQTAQLHKMLAGNDAVYNKREVLRYTAQIYEAVTDDDLDVIEEDVNQSAIKNYIGGKAQDQLLTKIETARAKTPEIQEIKRFRNTLSEVMKAHKLNVEDYSAQSEADEKSESDTYIPAALMKFDNQIENGIRPATAFWQTLSKLHQRKETIVKSFISTLPELGIPKVAVDDPKQYLTTEMIDTAMESLKKAAAADGSISWQVYSDEGDAFSQKDLGEAQRRRPTKGPPLTKKERLSIRRIYATEQKLKYIRTYAEIPIEQRKVPDEPDKSGSDRDETQHESPFDRALKWFKGVID